MRSCDLAHEKYALRLIAHGAALNISDKVSMDILGITTCTANCLPQENSTALLLACQAIVRSIVLMLLENGADANMPNQVPYALLYPAVDDDSGINPSYSG
jgi:ankyrin repeat protein